MIEALSNKFSRFYDGTVESPALIWRKEGMQGGAWCLKDSRLAIYGIIEAMKPNGSVQTYQEMAKVLKKYWGYKITANDLEKAVQEYETALSLMYSYDTSN